MEACLTELGYTGVRRTGQGGGGSISYGETYTTDEGNIFVKKNENVGARMMFEGEFASLLAIASTDTLRVPLPVAVLDNPLGPGAVLVMENLYLSGLLDHAQLGRNLAKLHLHNRGLSEVGSLVFICTGYFGMIGDGNVNKTINKSVQALHKYEKGGEVHCKKKPVPGFIHVK